MPTIKELTEKIKKGERLTHEEIGDWLLDIEVRLQKEKKKHGES